MTKDYKNRLNKKRAPKPVPGWLWMLCGLGIGLMVAGVVYLRSSFQASGFQANSAKVEPAGNEQRNEAQKKKPEQKEVSAVARPRFEFYTILPDMEVRVPDDKVTGPSYHGVRKVEQEGTYLLQVGSFRSFEQAGRLKEQLAQLDLKVSIKSISMDKNGTWHRVLAGPYRDLEQLNKVRARLRENSIDTILLKVKKPG